MRPHGSAEFLEQRRRRAIGLLERDLSLAAVARKVGVTTGAVWQWKQAYGRDGADGLKRKSCLGKGSRLTGRQRQSLMNMLDRGGLWTGSQIQRLVQQRFDVTYHVDHVRRLLHQLGYTPHLPQKQAQQRDATWLDAAQCVESLWRRFRRPIIIVCDRLAAHRKAVRLLRMLNVPRLTIRWPPAYAPELNPVEPLWSITKYAELRNYVPASDEAHEAAVRSSFTRPQRGQRLLRSFFQTAGLRLPFG